MERYVKGLILALLTLVAFATLTTSASAETSIPQLRSQLRSARQHLTLARQRLDTARSDYRIVLAAFEAQLAAATAADGTSGTTAGTTSTADGTTTTTDGTTATTGGTTATTDGTTTTVDPFAGLSPSVATWLLADRTVTQAEVDQLHARVLARKAIVRHWAVVASDLRLRLDRQLQIREWNRTGTWLPLCRIAGARYGVNADNLYQMLQYESGGNRYAGSTYRGLFQYYPGTWSGSWNPWRGSSIYDGWAQIRATAYAIDRGMGPSQWPVSYRLAF